MTKQEINQLIKDIDRWAKKAKKFKWVKIGYGAEEFYDWDELAASIQAHIGLTKLVDKYYAQSCKHNRKIRKPSR